MAIQRALLSVSDKRGLIELGRALRQFGVELVATSGTAHELREAGVQVRAVSDYTGAPEILDGRVKTLHPAVHGGLLARDTDADRAELTRRGIETIDLAIVNLYPFADSVAAPNTTCAQVIEQIDIGGPTMLRAAAKNHERVGVVVDPDDYTELLKELAENGRCLSAATRFRWACKAFAHTAAYDTAVAEYLHALPVPPVAGERVPLDREPSAGSEPVAETTPMPPTLTATWRRVRTLRYGENPHQTAAFYTPVPEAGGADTGQPGVARAVVLQGKPLSYNNILDLDAALACALALIGPAAVIVKHANPCGVAVDEAGIAAAYRRARATDPTSSFGAIVAVNRPVTEELASLLIETFLEGVIAPAYEGGARALLNRKQRLRVLQSGPTDAGSGAAAYAFRSVTGGVLVQSVDAALSSACAGEVVSARLPTVEELATLDFAWLVAKHVKSNAIVFCRGTETVGIGAGQMSRIDAARLAAEKACKNLRGTCVASDGFFPFRDGIDALAEAGATAVIQPGGSIRDSEVIAAADEHGLAMVFTGTRHFRH